MRRPYWIEGLNPMTGVLTGEMQREIWQTHREEGHVRTQEETGVMLLQAKEREPPEAERGRTANTLISGFWPLQLGRINYHPVCANFLLQPQETTQTDRGALGDGTAMSVGDAGPFPASRPPHISPPCGVLHPPTDQNPDPGRAQGSGHES